MTPKITLFSRIKNDKFRLFLIVFCNLIAVSFAILSLLLLEPFVKLLFSGSMTDLSPLSTFFISQLSKIVDIQQVTASMAAIVGIVIFLFLMKNLFLVLASWLMATVKSRYIQSLRNDLYEHITILPLSYFSKIKRGDVVSRAVNDVQELEFTLLKSLQQFLTDPITVIIYLVALFWIDVNLSLFTLCLLPVAGFFISLASRKLKRKSRLSKEDFGRLFSHVEESLGGLRIIKGFNAQKHAEKLFDKENKSFSKMHKQILWGVDLASPLSEFLGVSIVMVILVFGGWQVLSGTGSLTAPLFIVYIALITQLINPAKNISTSFANYKRGMAVQHRINEILLADEKIIEKENAISVSTFVDKIEYKNVSFSYNDNNEVIKDFSLIINKGEMCAIIGPSGVGKSTIVDLLPRFYDVSNGAILIDGVDIRDMKIDELRSLFAIVTQDVVLFNETIYNNLTYGMQDVPMERVREAAKAAVALEFIEQLPQKFDTVLSDRGLSLSGGQRQRLSIARAILRNAPILILDEATSALDTESEKKVQQAIEELMKERTVIVIAHRLSTIENATKTVAL